MRLFTLVFAALIQPQAADLATAGQRVDLAEKFCDAAKATSLDLPGPLPQVFIGVGGRSAPLDCGDEAVKRKHPA
jgi:hypothetical protein